MTVSNSLPAPVASENRSKGKPQTNKLHTRNDETIQFAAVARGERHREGTTPRQWLSVVVFHKHQVTAGLIDLCV